MTFARLLLTFLLAIITSIASAQTASNAKKQEAQNTTDIPESWLSQVKKDIRQREYRITKKSGANAWQSPNRAQNLRITYHPDEVEMRPRKDSANDENWHFTLQTLGLYADVKQIQGTNKDASVQVKDSMANFRHGPIKIQYLNTKKGLRQNFIVEELEDKPETLEVKLQSKGLKVKQKGKAELQFYKEENGKKQITYNDLKVWDANGKTLPARFETKGQNIHIRVKAGNAEYPITIDPLSTTADWVAEGNKRLDEFGVSVSNAGDVNGDGYDDVIVGARDLNKGRAVVYHGSQNGLSKTADWIANGDSGYVSYDFSVSTAGDVNGDGYDDIIVGFPEFSNDQDGEGRALLYLGGANGLNNNPAWISEGNQAHGGFGWSVSTAGDINGDGYDDVIIGANTYENGQRSEGRAFLYSGNPNGLSQKPDWTAEGNQAYAEFGRSVSSAGDVNGDGYDDVIVGANYYENGQRDEGRVFLYHGSPNGLSPKYDWIKESNYTGANYGHSVSTAGDVNGDGYDDVIVGAWQYSDNTIPKGWVFVYHGSANGLSQNADWTAESAHNRASFGFSVSIAGDVNGDGYDDVIIGVPYYNPGSRKEEAFVYKGSSDGLSPTADWSVKSDQAEASLGWSVSTAGDVNGDGYDDVLIGAPEHSNDQKSEGRAFVFYGKCPGTPAPDRDSLVLGTWQKNPVEDSVVTYSVENIPQADTFIWSLPNDWQTVERQSDTLIRVQVGAEQGEVCVNASNSCGSTGDTCLKVKPAYALKKDTTACEGDTLTLSPLMPNVKDVHWNTGDTTKAIKVAKDGKYFYEAVTKDSVIYLDTINVAFAPHPHVYVGPSQQAFCGWLDTTIVPETKNAQTYQWNTGDTTKTLHVDEEGQYWLRVESEESCSNADTTQIQEIAYPEDFDTNQIEVCEATVQLDPGNPGASHIWNTGDTTQKITVDKDGQYIVSIANAYCSIRDTAEVEVNEESACPYLFVPNAFSPNDDGLNDVFKPEGQKILDYEMTIYNRWGQRVFHSEAVDQGWDGTVEGAKAPLDSYLYQITYKIREDGILQWKTKEGMVQLVR